MASKRFDVTLPHPIRRVQVEMADSARYNDCCYVRSCWYVHVFTHPRFASWVCNIPLSERLHPTFLFHVFFPLYYLRPSRIVSFLLAPISISSKLSWFSIFADIFVGLNRRGDQNCQTNRVNSARRSGGGLLMPHNQAARPLSFSSSHFHRAVPNSWRRSRNHSWIQNAARIMFRLNARSHPKNRVLKLRGNGFCNNAINVEL